MGSRGTGGCIFCSGGSGYFTAAPEVAGGPAGRRSGPAAPKDPEARAAAYFQAHTNTYAPLPRLKDLYERVSAVRRHLRPVHRHPARCAEGGNNGLLKELNERTLLTVELGLQTIHERTARIINRGYDLQEFMEAYKALKNPRHSHLCPSDQRAARRNKTDDAGIRRLSRPIEAGSREDPHAPRARDTPMETLYRRKKYRPLSRDEYIRLVCCQLRCFRQKL